MRCVPRPRDQPRGRRVAPELRVAEQQAELGHRAGEAEGLARAPPLVVVREGTAQEAAGARLGVLVAELQGEPLVAEAGLVAQGHVLVAELPGGVLAQLLLEAGRHDLVERRHRVARAHVAGILPVVIEILLGQHPVLVPHQPVGLHPERVPLQLELHVLGDGEQRAAQLVDEHLPCLALPVDIGVVAVALVGELFHHRVAQVAGAEAQHREEDPILPLLLDDPDQLALAARPDVEVAVGGEDDAVVPGRLEVPPGHVVGQLDSFGAGGRAPRLQAVEGGEDLLLVASRGGGEHQPGGPGIDHDGHPVLRPEAGHHELEGALHQRQLVRFIHRAGDIEQEHQVAGGQLLGIEVLPLEPHQEQLVLGVPGAGAPLEGHREGVAVGRLGIVVREVVDELLHPDRVGGGQGVLVEEAPDVAVARRVDVDREGRERVAGRLQEPVLVDTVIFLAGGVPLRPRGDQPGLEADDAGLGVPELGAGSTGGDRGLLHRVGADKGVPASCRDRCAVDQLLGGHGVARLHLAGGRGDLDLADIDRLLLEGEIPGGGLPLCHHQVDHLGRLVPDELRQHPVGPDRHLRDEIVARGVGDRAERRMVEADLGAGDGRARLVPDVALDGPGLRALAQGMDRREQQERERPGNPVTVQQRTCGWHVTLFPAAGKGRGRGMREPAGRVPAGDPAGCVEKGLGRDRWTVVRATREGVICDTCCRAARRPGALR